jgi:hypothetical protein
MIDIKEHIIGRERETHAVRGEARVRTSTTWLIPRSCEDRIIFVSSQRQTLCWYQSAIVQLVSRSNRPYEQQIESLGISCQRTKTEQLSRLVNPLLSYPSHSF